MSGNISINTYHIYLIVSSMETKKLQTTEIKVKVCYSFNVFSLSLYDRIYPWRAKKLITRPSPDQFPISCAPHLSSRLCPSQKSPMVKRSTDFGRQGDDVFPGAFLSFTQIQSPSKQYAIIILAQIKIQWCIDSCISLADLQIL